MSISTYATIDIGSTELSMKIFEISKKYGIKELTYVRHKMSLGSETYRNKFISYKTIDEICNTINDYKRIMDEYKVVNCKICSGSSIREAKNAIVIVDQIKVQTGFDVQVLSNSEGRFLHFKALAINQKNFDEITKDGTLIIDIGSGSIQLSVFNKNKLCYTQNLLLGVARIHELLLEVEDEAYDYDELLDEYMEKDIINFKRLYLNKIKINNIIAIGGTISEIYSLLNANIADFDSKLPVKILEKARLPKSIYPPKKSLITTTLICCKKISELVNCNNVFLSNITLCDSIAADFGEKKYKIIPTHNFTDDIIEASKNSAKKYKVDMVHVENIEKLATQIFDKNKKLHGLGKRERLLLQIAVILHSCGSYVSLVRPRDAAYAIIMATEIIGISHKERTMVANMVKYNDSFFPAYDEMTDEFTRDEYITIVKLNAIIKTANVLDKSNRQKIKNVDVTLNDDILTITADTMADITLEKGIFSQKANVFQDVFGIKPVLKQKRSGRNG